MELQGAEGMTDTAEAMEQAFLKLARPVRASTSRPQLRLPLPLPGPPPPTRGGVAALLPARSGEVLPPAASAPAGPMALVLPVLKNPAAVYLLSSLAPGPSRETTASALRTAARLFGCELDTMPWHEIGAREMHLLRGLLAENYAPSSANRILSAVRQVLQQAWDMDQIDGEACRRACRVKPVKGSREPPGRALEEGECAALFRACADGTVSGARDAAAFALMFGCGLRRHEASGLDCADIPADDRALRVIGKGNVERTVYPPAGARDAFACWLSVRGDEPGPFLTPVLKGGVVRIARLTPQALRLRLQARAGRAGLARGCTPHDLRRTFISQLLEAGGDIAMVQKLVGHASPRTTSRYDRRSERAKAKTAALLHVPFVNPLPAA